MCLHLHYWTCIFVSWFSVWLRFLTLYDQMAIGTPNANRLFSLSLNFICNMIIIVIKAPKKQWKCSILNERPDHNYVHYPLPLTMENRLWENCKCLPNHGAVFINVIVNNIDDGCIDKDDTMRGSHISKPMQSFVICTILKQFFFIVFQIFFS